jgi:hypothetical protein
VQGVAIRTTIYQQGITTIFDQVGAKKYKSQRADCEGGFMMVRIASSHPLII